MKHKILFVVFLIQTQTHDTLFKKRWTTPGSKEHQLINCQTKIFSKPKNKKLSDPNSLITTRLDSIEMRQ